MSDGRMIRTAVKPNRTLSGIIAEINIEELKTEIFRKGIHMMVALVPAAAAVNINITLLMLASAVVVYSFSEACRINGRTIALISGITIAAARKRDEGGFVLGPVTLAVGAMLALMLYPSTAAAVAIYALAFGDSAASLIGKFFGRIQLPAFGNKTLEGSLACAFVVYAAAFAVTSDSRVSVVIAFSTALIELVPIKDLDNLLIPVGTGVVAALLI